MEIIIEGTRTDPRDWREAQALPREKLHPLSSEQKEVVRKLKLSEEGYARTILASEKTQERLVSKARRFGNILLKKLETAHPGMKINWVSLATIELKYYVEVMAGSETFKIRFDESTVNDLLEGGSKEADNKIDGILERVIADRVV